MKSAAKYTELREIDCMRALARAHKNRNLGEFEKTLREYHDGPSLPSLSSLNHHTHSLMTLPSG